MVKFLKILSYTILFILAIGYFFPKINFYYLLENEFKKNNIILSQEKIIDKAFSLEINEAKLYFKKIETADIESINIKTFLVYNSVSVENIKLSTMAVSFTPISIDNIYMKYTIFNPLNIVGEVNGEFGKAMININIIDRKMNIVVLPSKLMLDNYKNTLRNLKKNEDGEYEYVKNF